MKVESIPVRIFLSTGLVTEADLSNNVGMNRKHVIIACPWFNCDWLG